MRRLGIIQNNIPARTRESSGLKFIILTLHVPFALTDLTDSICMKRHWGALYRNNTSGTFMETEALKNIEAATDSPKKGLPLPNKFF